MTTYARTLENALAEWKQNFTIWPPPYIGLITFHSLAEWKVKITQIPFEVFSDTPIHWQRYFERWLHQLSQRRM